MINKFFPLWYADIISTEKKLSRLAENGLHLTGFSPAAGVFVFEEGEKRNVRYRICYAKGCCGKPPKGISESGWEPVCGNKNYYVVKNTDPNAEKVPSYSSWKTVNRAALLAAFLVICFFIGFTGGAAAGAADAGENIFSDPVILFGTVISAAALAVLIIAFKGNRSLAKTDTDLKLADTVIKTIPAENFRYSEEEEKRMLKDGRMIKKLRLAWVYAPDKAERWVEEMAANGWRFYRFNTTGIEFYFVKSEPVKLKFIADYQNEATEEYFQSCRDDGWHLEYTSVTRIMSFVIWSREYEGEEPPEIYTDAAGVISHARRLALSIGLPMTLVAAVAVAVIAVNVFFCAPEERDIPMAVIYFILGVEYGLFGSQSIGYYIRTVKKYGEKK
ncbi:MAG: DUF2812 domain-containing protein [Ruminococcus sp.]|nr:DUF2812 domain-containing protein [Ruminococcus sp.]